MHALLEIRIKTSSNSDNKLIYFTWLKKIYFMVLFTLERVCKKNQHVSVARLENIRLAYLFIEQWLIDDDN